MIGSDILRILLADDDKSFALLVRRALAEHPDTADRCTLTCVMDGGAAVDYVVGRGAYVDRVHHPMPHLVLLDQRMTLMDGTEALRQIRQEPRARYIPVCLLSTSAQPSLLEEAYDAGASFCIEKPMDFDALQAKLSLTIRFAIEVLELPRRM